MIFQKTPNTLKINTLTLTLLFVFSFSANSAIYIKLDDIEGEATDQAHENWVELLSVSDGMSATSSDATGRGSVSFSDLRISKSLDRTSPILRGALAQGRQYSKVMIHIDKRCEENVVYFEYELDNVLITSISLSGSAASDAAPTEEISLNFEKIKWTYTEFENCMEKGKTAASWDIRTNTP